MELFGNQLRIGEVSGQKRKAAVTYSLHHGDAEVLLVRGADHDPSPLQPGQVALAGGDVSILLNPLRPAPAGCDKGFGDFLEVLPQQSQPEAETRFLHLLQCREEQLGILVELPAMIPYDQWFHLGAGQTDFLLRGKAAARVQDRGFPAYLLDDPAGPVFGHPAQEAGKLLEESFEMTEGIEEHSFGRERRSYVGESIL